MTFHDYLAKLQSQNPNLFAAKEIRIRVASFREQLEAAYKAGESNGRAENMFETLFPPLSKRGGMDRE